MFLSSYYVKNCRMVNHFMKMLQQNSHNPECNFVFYMTNPPLSKHISQDKEFQQWNEVMVYYKVTNNQFIEGVDNFTLVYGFNLNDSSYSSGINDLHQDKILKVTITKDVHIDDIYEYYSVVIEKYPYIGGVEFHIENTGNIVGYIHNLKLVGDIKLLASKEWQVVGKPTGKIYTTKMQLHKRKIIMDIKSIFPKEDYMFLHMSFKKIRKAYSVRQINETDEPSGLYYGINFVRFLEGDFNESYMYGIRLVDTITPHTTLEQPNKEKILLLKSKKDIKDFVQKYGKYNDEYNIYEFNWLDVSKSFGGIQWEGDTIYKYFNYKSQGYGCIWNSKLVKDIILVGIRTNDNWVIRKKLHKVIFKQP